MRAKLLLLGIILTFALGCGRGQPMVDSGEKYISLDEWKKMPPEERYEPFVLERLQRQPRKQRAAR